MAKHYTLPSIYICVRLCCFNIMYEIILTRSTVPERRSIEEAVRGTRKVGTRGVHGIREVERRGRPQH
jgi:hypothetical protein